jgi:glutamine synthetase
MLGTIDYDALKTLRVPLKHGGDFRSEECINYLQQADIVITNPPFSLFREYMAQLMKYKKQFLIIGNENAITYKEIFPLFQQNKLWFGYNNGHYWFRVPSSYGAKKTDYKVDDEGNTWRRMGNIG